MKRSLESQLHIQRYLERPTHTQQETSNRKDRQRPKAFTLADAETQQALLNIKREVGRGANPRGWERGLVGLLSCVCVCMRACTHVPFVQLLVLKATSAEYGLNVSYMSGDHSEHTGGSPCTCNLEKHQNYWTKTAFHNKNK